MEPKKIVTQMIVSSVAGLLFLSSGSSNIFIKNESAYPLRTNGYSFEQLDLRYIFNITERLSNIIFTEYNTSNGEIAKGRAYGTKGEQKAAEIIYENLTTLGLFTYTERITGTSDYPNLTQELEIITSSVKINNKTVDAYIAPVWVKTPENSWDLNHTYAYDDLRVIHPPLCPGVHVSRQKLSGTLEPFIVIVQDRGFYPNNTLDSIPFLDNLYVNYFIRRQLQGGIPLVYSYLWTPYLDYCKGIILYDFNKDVHDMNLLKNKNHLPFIYINKTDGETILRDIQNTRVDFTLTQQLNTTVISNNVIGQINGTDPTKTVIVDSLYDSWWCQGTADSAIGMAIVLAVAKNIKEHNITPKYTLKFIGFSGEEHGFCAGAKHYASTHTGENIVAIIDFNQVGFRQDAQPLTLNIIGNNLRLLSNISVIIQQSDYVNRVNSSKDLKYVWLKKGIISNPFPFQTSHPNCKILCFLKDGGWQLHHRDGVNHTKGDVLQYFDPEDVNVTGEIVLNVVKYLATDT